MRRIRLFILPIVLGMIFCMPLMAVDSIRLKAKHKRPTIRSVYPCPAEAFIDKATLTVAFFHAIEQVSVTVEQVEGDIIHDLVTDVCANEGVTIDLSSALPGEYLLTISFGDMVLEGTFVLD